MWQSQIDLICSRPSGPPWWFPKLSKLQRKTMSQKNKIIIFYSSGSTTSYFRRTLPTQQRPKLYVVNQLVLYTLVRLNKNNFSFLFFFICLFLCFFVCLSNPTCPYKNPSISVLILLACSIISNISPLHQVAVHLPCVCVIHAFCNSKVFPFSITFSSMKFLIFILCLSREFFLCLNIVTVNFMYVLASIL